jgi:hypothetical protein
VLGFSNRPRKIEQVREVNHLAMISPSDFLLMKDQQNLKIPQAGVKRYYHVRIDSSQSRCQPLTILYAAANPPSKRRTTPANSRKPGPRDDEDEGASWLYADSIQMSEPVSSSEPNMKHRAGASKVQPQKADDTDEGSIILPPHIRISPNMCV